MKARRYPFYDSSQNNVLYLLVTRLALYINWIIGIPKFKLICIGVGLFCPPQAKSEMTSLKRTFYQGILYSRPGCR